jgi:hypothetical protein
VSQRIDSDARSGWFANSAIGYRISKAWVAQLELDLNQISVNFMGQTAFYKALTPQVGWQITPALQLVVGESFGRTAGNPNSTTMTNVMFEYNLDMDNDEAN